MEDILVLIGEVGLPIGGALASGFFIFLVMKQLLQGVVDNIDTLMNFTKALENRARTMNNELIKIDMLVSSALELRPDIERVARAENYVEDGKIDKQNNPLKNAPHTAEYSLSSSWDHPYSRNDACFPGTWQHDYKYWPSVSRIDNAFGDRNLICSCPPIDQYRDQEN